MTAFAAVSPSGDAEPAYRRSGGLVFHWSAAGFTYFDCRTGQRRTAPVGVVPLLDQLPSWRTALELVHDHPELGSLEDVEQLLARMEAFGLVEQQGARQPDWIWNDWMPEAAFFHFGTRDADYPADLMDHELPLVEKARSIPQPPPVKHIAGPRHPLPAAAPVGSLGDTLRERRTWRQLSAEPVSLQDLATLLKWTWGVQRRGHVRGQGDVVFKTSPSGGARHPIEAYVLALAVDGLANGAYHYDCLEHSLVPVSGAVARDRFVSVLGNQYYFRNCAAAIVLTACFERPMWRYPFPRAYRSVLIEAGHLAQTFALLATQLQLAPFQTVAFRDTELEAMVGLSGPSESAMYVLGVSRREPGNLDHPGRIRPKER